MTADATNGYLKFNIIMYIGLIKLNGSPKRKHLQDSR